MVSLAQIEEWIFEGIVECKKCGNLIEPDCPECYCGWKNPIVRMGLI